MIKRLEPAKEELFLLYYVPVLLLAISIYGLFALDFDPIVLVMAIPLSLMALGFHLKQKSNLKLIKLDGESTIENYDTCIKVVKENGWQVLESNMCNKILAHTKFSWRSWGELITIIFESDVIYINSRPSPYRFAAITTLGKNKQNIAKFKAVLKKSSPDRV